MPASVTRSVEKVFPFRDSDAAIRSVVILSLSIVLGIVTFLIVDSSDLPTGFIDIVALPGTLWVNIISSIMVVFIFSLVTLTIIDSVRSGSCFKFALKYLLYVYSGHLIAALLAIIIYLVFQASYEAPSNAGGSGVTFESLFDGYVSSITNTVVNFFSPNLFSAITSQHYATIIAYAILFGLTLHKLGYTGAESALTKSNVFFNSLVFDVALVIPSVVVFSKVYSSFSMNEFPLDTIMISFILGWVLLSFAIWPVFLYVSTKENPFKFLFNVQNAPIFAFATKSSITTVPITLTTVEKEMDVERYRRELLIPIGAVVNVPGSVFYGVLFSLISLKLFSEDGPSFGNFVYLLLFSPFVFAGLSGPASSLPITFSLVFMMDPSSAASLVMLMIPYEFFADSMRTALNTMADIFMLKLLGNSENSAVHAVEKVPEVPAPREETDV
ncbi:hypothetical protein P9112_014644 [Eukaryota sp. TZLM1-RC]